MIVAAEYIISCLSSMIFLVYKLQRNDHPPCKHNHKARANKHNIAEKDIQIVTSYSSWNLIVLCVVLGWHFRAFVFFPRRSNL